MVDDEDRNDEESDELPTKKIPIAAKKTKPINRYSDGDDDGEESDILPKKKIVSIAKKSNPSKDSVNRETDDGAI